MRMQAISSHVTYMVSLEKSGAEGPNDTSSPTTDKVSHTKDDELNHPFAAHRLRRGGWVRHNFVDRRCHDLEGVDLDVVVGLLDGGIGGYGTFLAGRAAECWRSLLIDGEQGRASHGGIQVVARVQWGRTSVSSSWQPFIPPAIKVGGTHNTRVRR